MAADYDFKFEVGDWVRVISPWSDVIPCIGRVIQREAPDWEKLQGLEANAKYMLRLHGTEDAAPSESSTAASKKRHVVVLDPLTCYESELEIMMDADFAKAWPGSR